MAFAYNCHELQRLFEVAYLRLEIPPRPLNTLVAVLRERRDEMLEILERLFS